MRKNIVQSGNISEDGRTYIDYDWFDKGIPGNVKMAKDVYIDTSYGFSAFHSVLPVAMTMGKGSGCYDRASFITGKEGKIETGEFNIMNGSTFFCNKKITIGNHCMFAWGSLITDSWINDKFISMEQRRKWLNASAKDPLRLMPLLTESQPVYIEDNVWVGFDAVVLPGVKLGRGCIVGSKSIVSKDVPQYAIVAGNPLRVIRYLQPDDSDEAKTNAMNEYLYII